MTFKTQTLVDMPHQSVNSNKTKAKFICVILSSAFIHTLINITYA